MPCVSGEEEAVDLWAMATELERQFAGYKQRLAERDTGAAAIEHVENAAATAAACNDNGGGEEEDGIISEVMRGRMYEAYVRRRDERLREGWRARMERKEAEVKALWAQLDLTARAAADRAPGAGADGDPSATTTTDDAGDERKTEPKDDDKIRRSSDTAPAPRRITGKKHARTRSFSSSITTTTSNTRSDVVGRRRAVSQEPPPSSEPQAAVDVTKDNGRVGPAGSAAAARTTTATARPKTSSSLHRKSSVKGHGSAKPKLPRSLPRPASSGGFEALGREVVLPVVTGEAALVQSCSSEYAANGETPKVSASSPMQFVVKDNSSDVTGATNTRVSSPELSDPGEVVETVAHGEHESKDADVEERGEEKKIDDSPEKHGSPNGEITSDSETEPSYVVYIHKDTAKQEQAMAVSEPLKLAGSDAAMDSDVRTNEEENSEEIMPAPAGSTAVEIATTNAEEAPARESSDESPFSVRSSGLRSARPSCSSIERLLEEDAALLRRKREERAEKKSGGGAPKTPPGSAGSRVSGGAARSPRETVRGFKRFLSFGKKNRGREVTVIECASPSVSSLADDDSGSGGWQSAGSIKPRMGSSDAASDDTEHGYPVSSPRASCSLQSLVAASPAKSELAEISPQEKSPKAHRSFFSFRSLNCGRG
ncbi:hypothetical protein HU200_041446 [Digitaria exilis]|uniref:Uncharacterized protein n=1 Tax=Digitaria exilis TaxID=1010633 RepID=A0A835BHR2_9POAL|nr:hypothetical protein HU200_041446 [Digitaria exilis]